MKRATVADGENRSVELEVADVLLQLQHKDDPSTDAPTDQGPQGGGVVDHRDHSNVPTATPLHRAASVPTSRSLTRSDQDTVINHLASTTTTTTPSAAYSFEPGQMQHPPTTSTVPRRLGIDFLLNHPPAPSSSSSSVASPPSPSSSPELSFDRHGSWPPRPYHIIEETNTATSQGGATRRADLQGHYSTKSDPDYIVIEEEEEEEEDQNDYALRSPLEEGETATQTDRCLSSSDEDNDEAGGPPPVLVGYGLASMATTTRAAATTTSSSARRRPQRPLAPAPQPPLGGEDHRRPPPDSAARKSLNEKLRQRLEEKRRRSVAQATKSTSSSSSTPPSADQEVHYAGRRATSTREAGDEEEQQAGSTRGSSRVGAANLSTPGGRRGVATKKELDIWEQLMLTSVIQPLLPSSSSSHSHPTPTLSSSLPSTLSSSSSASSSSRRGRHQQQPEAPVTCMCALGPPPGLAAYPYISHGHNHSHSSALPHWGGPPPLAEELHLSADLFLDDYDYDNVSWYRAAEERKRKREPKNESDDEGGHHYYGSYPRHLARSVPAYQSQAYDHHRQSRRPRLDPSDQPSGQAALLAHPHEDGRHRDLSSPRRPRDRSALVFHHHTGAPVLDARTRLPGSE